MNDDGLTLLLDALVLSLESGMSFDIAVRGAATGGGPAAALAGLIASELALGRGRKRALERFAKAVGGDAERVAGVVYTAQKLGVPLAQVLAVHADALRLERRREAEARARRLPVLILFPLTICILPALLILFLGPPVLGFFR
jgi:tight adherence protein C